MTTVNLASLQTEVNCPRCRSAKLERSPLGEWFTCSLCHAGYSGDTLVAAFDDLLKDRRRAYGIVSIEATHCRRESRGLRRKIGLRLVRPLKRLAAEVSVVATGGFKGDIGDSQKWASRALDRLNDEASCE